MSTHDKERRVDELVSPVTFGTAASHSRRPRQLQLSVCNQLIHTAKYGELCVDSEQSSGGTTPVSERLQLKIESPTPPLTGDRLETWESGKSADTQDLTESPSSRSSDLLVKREFQSGPIQPFSQRQLGRTTSAIAQCSDKRPPSLSSSNKPRSFTDYYDIKTTLSAALSSTVGDSRQLDKPGDGYYISQTEAEGTSGLSVNESSTAVRRDGLQVHPASETYVDVKSERKQQPYIRNPSYVKAQTEGNILSFLPAKLQSHLNSESEIEDFSTYSLSHVSEAKIDSSASGEPPSSKEYESEGPRRKAKTGSNSRSTGSLVNSSEVKNFTALPPNEGQTGKLRYSASLSTDSSACLSIPSEGQIPQRKISSAGISNVHFRPSIGSPKFDSRRVKKNSDAEDLLHHRDDESVTSETTICSLEIQGITHAWKGDTDDEEGDDDHRRESITPVPIKPSRKSGSGGLSSRTSSVSSSSIKLSKVKRVPNLASFRTLGSGSVSSSRRSSDSSEKEQVLPWFMMSEQKDEMNDGLLSPTAVRKPPMPFLFGSPPSSVCAEQNMSVNQLPKGRETLEVLQTNWKSYLSPVTTIRASSPSVQKVSPNKSPRSSPTQLNLLSRNLNEKLNKFIKSPTGTKSFDTNANIERSDSLKSNPVSGSGNRVVIKRCVSMRDKTKSPEIMVTPPSSPSTPRPRRHAVASLYSRQPPKTTQNWSTSTPKTEPSVVERAHIIRATSLNDDSAMMAKRRVSMIEEDEGLEADYTPTSERFNQHEPVNMKGVSVEEYARGKGRRNNDNLRFVTHPPEKSGPPPDGEESGPMDSNGFGPLRGGNHPPHEGELNASSELSSMSIPDSCAGVSITSDMDASDLPSPESNGKRGKKPWRSDPSGYKKEYVDLPMMISSVQAQSTPSLNNVENEKLDGARVHSDEGIDHVKRVSLNSSKSVPATVVTPSTPMQAVRSTRTSSLGQKGRKADTLPLPGQLSKNIVRSHSEAHMYEQSKTKFRQSSSAVRLSEEQASPSTETLWTEPDHQSPSSRRKMFSDISSSLDLDSRFQTPSPSESTTSIYQDKRYHIVSELAKVEQEYVDNMSVLFQEYVVPLKGGTILDPAIVNEMFYNIRIPEIFNHHAVFLSLLSKEVKNWSQQTTIGDIVVNTFSKKTVEDSYMSYVKNYTKSKELIEHYEQTKGAFQKFLEQVQKGNRRRHGWKDLIIQPSHRIPRYGLLLRRLLKSTSDDHPDKHNIEEAIRVIDRLASTINCDEGEKEGDPHNTLKKIEELLSVSDLAVPERTYLRHDVVQVLGKKDQCCIWTFSDMVVLTTIKRRTGPVNKRTSILLKSPTGQDFIENCKQKILQRASVEDVEVYNSPDTLTRKRAKDKDVLEEDLETLKSVSEAVEKLHCDHQALDDMVRDLVNTVNNKLTEYELRSPPLDLTKLEIIFNTLEGIPNCTVQFSSSDKRSSWEQCLSETKQKLSSLTDRLPPVFMQYLPITKTRAGMQFSCACPIDGLNNNHYRDVWVCNSDGYVGHMCLLSLQPEPIVPQNTPVPGCNAKIMCICAVPAWSGGLKRKASRRIQQPPRKASDMAFNQTISMESTDFSDEDDSSSSDDESSIRLQLPSEGDRAGSPGLNESPSKDGSQVLDPRKSTMWLGTDDGYIHIFPCSENIKVTKNKLRIAHSTAVLYMMYYDHKVYVSLSNGDLIIYERTEEGCWDKNRYRTIPIGTLTTPVTRMLSVTGKLWCSRGSEILILEPDSCNTEQSFQVNSEASQQPVLSMALSRQGVCAIALQGSLKVSLYHATRYEHLMDVSIAQAVGQKLQTADDIIRQHKTACLKITALLAVKDLLWVGTSAGVILTIPLPKVTATTARSSLQPPQVTGLPCGHTGHVRFLTCVEMPQQLVRKTSSPAEPLSPRKLEGTFSLPRRPSAQPTSMSTKMLVISGGDGFEDFRVNANNETAGKEDSTNHLLLWKV